MALDIDLSKIRQQLDSCKSSGLIHGSANGESPDGDSGDDDDYIANVISEYEDNPLSGYEKYQMLASRDLVYEAISDFMDVEINAAMPPAIVYKIISDKLRVKNTNKEMVPDWVYEFFESLRTVLNHEIVGGGNSKLLTSRVLRFYVVKDGDVVGRFNVLPVGLAVRNMFQMFKDNICFQQWCISCNMEPYIDKGKMVLQSPTLEGWSEQQMNTILKNFDRYASIFCADEILDEMLT